METEIKEFSFIGSIKTIKKEQNLSEETNNAEKTDTHKAVALIGDRFYQGAFVPATELEKAYKGWENTLHDFNHQGTTHFQGLTATSDILYFVGYNKNVTYDKESKSVSMDIDISDETFYSKAWRGYVSLCEKAGQTPNVSVNFYAKTKRVQAKELPEGVNYTEFGLKPTDYIDYVYDIEPGALSTVYRGACSDSDGCGIGKCDCTNHTEEEINESEELEKEEKEALIKWLKENE